MPGSPPRGGDSNLLVDGVGRSKGRDGQSVTGGEFRIAAPRGSDQHFGQDAGRKQELIALVAPTASHGCCRPMQRILRVEQR